MTTQIPFAIDFHVHSDDSYDGHEPIELILEHAADIGLDGVVITDHDEIDESRRATDLAPEYGLIGIPGVEVSTRHGHLLAIGVEKRPDPGQPFMETVETVRDLGGVAIVPIPSSAVATASGNATSTTPTRSRPTTRWSLRATATGGPARLPAVGTIHRSVPATLTTSPTWVKPSPKSS